jgi:hypothetical protein
MLTEKSVSRSPRLQWQTKNNQKYQEQPHVAILQLLIEKIGKQEGWNVWLNLFGEFQTADLNPFNI